ESRPNWRHFQPRELMPLAGLAGWSMLGTLAYYLTMQSSDVILNLFFGAAIGTAVNAAYALAMQISTYQNSLGSVFTRTISPAIVGVQARGDQENVKLLTVLAGKWSAIVSLFYLIPLQFETTTILHMWLGRSQTLPPYAETFVRLVSACMWCGMLGQGFNL